MCIRRIAEKFVKLREKNEKALIPFITAGDPDLKVTGELVLALEDAGADIIELGVPFSDPLADGPTIQASSQRALLAGVRLDKIFELVREIRKTTEVPIVLMSYYNPIYKYGTENFAAHAVSSGVDGVIISDLPPEEAAEWREHSQTYGLDTIFLAAPTSPRERIELVAQYTTGFIYCVSRTAVTGARDQLPEGLEELVLRIKSLSDKPVVVGFGISNPQQVHQVGQWSDGVVVGSALVQIIEDNIAKGEFLEKAAKFINEMKKATQKGNNP